jgi:hypothetical protein
MCFDYDETWDIYEQKTVKTRKPHKCDGCRRTIPKGAQADHCTGLCCHEWSSFYVCHDCQRMILSIVAEELREGCRWDEAWCAPQELRDYLRDRHEPVPRIGLRTLEDCRRYVDSLWYLVNGRITVDLMM